MIPLEIEEGAASSSTSSNSNNGFVEKYHDEPALNNGDEPPAAEGSSRRRRRLQPQALDDFDEQLVDPEEEEEEEEAIPLFAQTDDLEQVATAAKSPEQELQQRAAANQKYWHSQIAYYCFNPYGRYRLMAASLVAFCLLLILIQYNHNGGRRQRNHNHLSCPPKWMMQGQPQQQQQQQGGRDNWHIWKESFRSVSNLFMYCRRDEPEHDEKSSFFSVSGEFHHHPHEDLLSCHCPNPVLPQSRGNAYPQWNQANIRNQRLVQTALLQELHGNKDPLDLVLVGDDFVEHWLGTQQGNSRSNLQPQYQIYQQLFQQSPSSSQAPQQNSAASTTATTETIHGLALGIGGDGAPHVLFRLSDQGREMPRQFCPPLWWIIVGANDLMNFDCNVPTAIAGIVQLVEYIFQQQQNDPQQACPNKDHNTTIVLHSVLPRGLEPLHHHHDDEREEEHLINEAWHVISEFNQALQCLANSYHPNTTTTRGSVEFFNATKIFLVQDDPAGRRQLHENHEATAPTINTSLYMNDWIHPNALGAQLWGTEIVKQSLQLLGKGLPDGTSDSLIDNSDGGMNSNSDLNVPSPPSSTPPPTRIPTTTAPVVPPPTTDTNNQNHHTLVCSQQYTSYQGWDAWKTTLMNNHPPDDWCNHPNTVDHPCTCNNPFHPLSRENADWQAAFERNKQLVQQEFQQHPEEEHGPLDMLWIGDSIVEHWLGTESGQAEDEWQSNHEIYQALFRQPSGSGNSESLIRGLALGIAGDTCPLVLYRLQNGELPNSAVMPPLVWILVGTNDLVEGDCSAEAIAAGMIQLVQYIQQEQQQEQQQSAAPASAKRTTIVLHSILPRGTSEISMSETTTAAASAAGQYDSKENPWPLIHAINKQLECYAIEHHDQGVEYFDGTQFFLTTDQSLINATLMPDYLHPSGLGSIEWGIAIVRKSLELLGRPQPSSDAFQDLVTLQNNMNNNNNNDNNNGAAPAPPDEGDNKDDNNPVPPLSENHPNASPQPGESPNSQSCMDDYTDGQGWESWIAELKSMPDQEMCSSTSTNDGQGTGQCHCVSPLVPRGKGDRWKDALARNKNLLEQEESSGAPPLDLIMTGDSITEFWLGTYFASPMGQLARNVPVYQQLFRTNNDDNGSSSSSSFLHGLALGISGDECSNLLYRLQNGETPKFSIVTDPFVWWLLIGTNDLSNQCSSKAIAAGIIQIAEYIQQAYPTAVLVVNSILPRGQEEMDDPHNLFWNDIVEINQMLECYAASAAPRVEFFNATTLFLTTDQRRTNATMFMEDYLHPRDVGYLVWGEAIVRKSLELLGRPQPPSDAFPDIITIQNNYDNKNQNTDAPPSKDDPDASQQPEGHKNNQECTNLYTDGQGWESWMAELKATPDQNLCSTSHNNTVQEAGKCQCASPLLPAGKDGHRWTVAFDRNKNLLEQEEESSLDLIMSGDSITEYWLGTYLGTPMGQFASNEQVYQQLFRNDNNNDNDSSFPHGVALGIAGDECQNMLYRLQNGEIPKSSVVKNLFVWWLLIGTNDLSHRCSAKAIAAGVIQIAEFIAQVHPSAIVVVNSILPRGNELFDNSNNPFWNDILETNQILECYAASDSTEPRIEFFNATSLFLTANQRKVNGTLFMDDFIHLRGLGYLVWGEAIVRKSLELLGRPPPSPDAFQNIVIP
ncbi:hypothetical protein ACA910_019502 [Epithemia clementina (nom. ined.)]